MFFYVIVLFSIALFFWSGAHRLHFRHCNDTACSGAPCQRSLLCSEQFQTLIEFYLTDPLLFTQGSHKRDAWGHQKGRSTNADFVIKETYSISNLYPLTPANPCNFVKSIQVQRLRWSRGSVLAFSTQVRGFKPGRSRRIFRAKKSSARLPSEGK